MAVVTQLQRIGKQVNLVVFDFKTHSLSIKPLINMLVNIIEWTDLKTGTHQARAGWMHETSARAWCAGKTQRNRVEEEVGGRGDRDGEYM